MKKPIIQEILSKIEYDPSANPEKYCFVIRDKEDYIELTYEELKLMSEEHTIPTHRISLIRKDEDVLFVSPGCCQVCGKPIDEHKRTNHKIQK